MNKRYRAVWCALVIFAFLSLTAHSRAQTQVLADSPDANTLRIELLQRNPRDSGGEFIVLPRSYKRREELTFLLRMTNVGNRPLLMLIGRPIFQMRPELIKDGETLPYREDVKKRIVDSGDQDTVGNEKGTVLKLGESKSLGSVNLKDWYSDLDAGHYSLSIRHRGFGGVW